MAHHAWLDSLSEDWVSQPRSNDSQAQLDPCSSPPQESKTAARDRASRIPRLSATSKSSSSSQTTALHERSASDINVPVSSGGSPKAPLDSTGSQARSRSVSSAASVVHNTVNHKSPDSSPSKGTDQMPEWKRRLVYGDLAYGESKDLFSSAGTGLENMFKPPLRTEAEDEVEDAGEYFQEEPSAFNDMTLPSSPPPFLRQPRSYAQQDDFTNSNSNQHSEEADSIEYGQTGAIDSAENTSRYQQKTSREAFDSSQTSLSAREETAGSRKVSAASANSFMRHEDLSPIMLPRKNDADGRIDFAPMDAPSDQLKKRLEKLRRNQLVLDTDPLDLNRKPSSQMPRIDEKGEVDTTDDYMRGGGFLNVKRGGRSAEGSFRHRPLSPPLNTDSSEMLPESSLQASTPKQFPTLRTDRMTSGRSSHASHRPSTPDSSDVDDRAHLPPSQSRFGATLSTSPLKLFGPYDTFTNQTLLRRISQFEDPRSDSPSRGDGLEARMSPSHPANNFGAGELNDFEFSEDISIVSNDRSRFTNKENIDPEGSVRRMTNPIKFDIHEDLVSDGESLTVEKPRRRSQTSSTARYSRHSSSNSNLRRSRSNPTLGSFELLRLSTPKREGSWGKRPRTSPSKDPTPKRRRTLHKSDVAFGLVDSVQNFDLVHKSHDDLQDVIVWNGNTPQSASVQKLPNSAMLSSRHYTRPQSPTPNYKGIGSQNRQPLEEVDYGYGEYSSHDEEHDDSGFAPKSVMDASRKTSMKTQDFWDQANEIMAMIRSKARPKTSLDSVEESENEPGNDFTHEQTQVEDEDSYQSTEEPFSRPPSREGRPVVRIPLRQEDPELADRLKQYAELSDLGDLVSLSMGRIKEVTHEFNMVKESIDQSMKDTASRSASPTGSDFISDLPNVRLSRNPDAPDFNANGSAGSRVSSARSFPSGSSRNSDSRRLIAPDVVNQLIGEQVGNMVFDKEKQAWMKVRTPGPVQKVINVLPSDDSEEDPFASIPDLSVNMTQEKANLLGPATATNLSPTDSTDDQTEAETTTPERRFEGSPRMDQSPTTPPRSPHGLDADDREEVVDHEISIHEDRVYQTTSTRRRNLTITFSSPIASIIRDLPALDDDPLVLDSRDLEETVHHTFTSHSSTRQEEVRHTRSDDRAQQQRARSKSRGPARTLSVRGRAFFTRPVSRIDEHDEQSEIFGEQMDERQLSIIPDLSINGRTSDDEGKSAMSVVLTPAASRHASFAATPIIAQHVGTLSLSPLSEFTMLNADQSCALEVSYVVDKDYLVTGDGSKKINSKALRNLVEKITEVEPFEPDWQGMRELDIGDKKLTSLHMLDEFCGGVVTLEASKNSVRSLEGVPHGVRNLRITHNQLSELTAWGHLMNLQYVDVSNNNLTSLYAFKDLVHLRNLRADNNQITSLQGICYHETLQVLRARGNLIEDIDFEGSRLDRLSELDLENNLIESVRNVDRLLSLSSLNLQDNRLTELPTSPDAYTEGLRYLKISNNKIASLDLSRFPSLRLLHADRNSIASITGVIRCRRLDSLSLREQSIEGFFSTAFLSEACEVRKLFLSGNLLEDFYPQVDFLNLQYLELANCGLQRLPENIGQLMPNVRVLNINFNAIDDLAPLRFIPRLKKLMAAGNRLAEAGKVANVLAEFPHLSKLDLRDNPSTLGFYPPLQTLVYVNKEDSEEKQFDPFVLPDGNAERDAQFLTRSDMGTRMRRRLYEMVVLGNCGKLKNLDGLAINRTEISTRDTVWANLKKAGVFGKREGTVEDFKQRLRRPSKPLEEEEEDQEEEGHGVREDEDYASMLPERPVTPI